ncbi:hypothetical protein J3F83DRAFT_519359 [Trichoderma novae-zelandiae]
MTAAGFTRENILSEWKNCSTERDTAFISAFVVGEPDVDGHWAREREARERNNLPMPSDGATRVLFPRPNAAVDVSRRAQWFFQRSLFRRTYATYSAQELESAFAALSPTLFAAPGTEGGEKAIIDRACDLLSRLPETPISLPVLPQAPPAAEQTCWFKLEAGPYRWEDLEPVWSVSAPVRMALAIAATWDRSPEADPREKEWHQFREYLDSVSELIDAASYEYDKASSSDNRPHAWRWFIVKSYLWSAWQRCVALHYWRILQDNLITGFDYTDLSDLSLRPTIDSPAHLKQYETMKSEYMCSLSYQILIRSRSTALLDLRQFHQRFNDLFGEYSGRCNDDKACDGASPSTCRRIKGAVVIDQSQHDISCHGEHKCRRILWDEASYRRLTGARAVSLSELSDHSQKALLQYADADNSTLAISHVWSHGQGGRPETGLNECLHKRYCSITRAFGCSSYWIDAACIPSDHALRLEAIMTINQVFLGSRAMVLCDRDLMSIDISAIQAADDVSHEATSLRESLLCCLLASDWNVRAWTLLEALRGRKNIHILCKSGADNRLISLRDTLQAVCMNGAIDIGILLLTSYHLFPTPPSWHWMHLHMRIASPASKARSSRLWRRKVLSGTHEGQIIAQRIADGFVAVSEAATLLCQRFASRPGDDVVIWSLLVGKKPSGNASDLWTRGYDGVDLIPMDTAVYTGYLISSVPRLRLPGLSWAPSQPGVQFATDGSATADLYTPYDGTLSRVGTIEYPRHHLRAEWGVSPIRFEGSRAALYTLRTVHPVVEELITNYDEGILLQPLREVDTLDDTGKEEPAVVLASMYKGHSRGPLFAICGKRRTGEETPWEWLGVVDWGSSPLPRFEVKEILIG